MQLHFSRSQPSHLQISKMRIAPREVFLQRKLWNAWGDRRMVVEGLLLGSVCFSCRHFIALPLHRDEYICKIGSVCVLFLFSSKHFIALSHWFRGRVFFLQRVAKNLHLGWYLLFICTSNTFVNYIWVGLLLCWTEKHFITARKSKLRLMRPNCYAGRN